MTEATVSEVLEKAADLLEPEGAWTQKQLAKAADGKTCDPRSLAAVCWCMAGAIQRSTPLDANYEPYLSAVGATIRNIIPYWNDAPDRTQTEVVSALRQAASQAKR